METSQVLLIPTESPVKVCVVVEPLQWFASGLQVTQLRRIPLTPRSRLWSPATASTPNPLASALAALLGVPSGPLHGPVCLTAHPEPGLSADQVSGFSDLLGAITAHPRLLETHHAAGLLLPHLC